MKVGSQEDLGSDFKLKKCLHHTKLLVKDINPIQSRNSLSPILNHRNQLKVTTTTLTYIILYFLEELYILWLNLIGSHLLQLVHLVDHFIYLDERTLGLKELWSTQPLQRHEFRIHLQILNLLQVELHLGELQ
jgi:hypothetical protein